MRPTAFLYGDNEKEIAEIELGDKSLEELFSLLKENGFTPIRPEIDYNTTPSSTSDYGGHYYELFTVPNYFQSAKEFTQQRTHDNNHGYVVTISSVGENGFVTDLLTKNGVESVWLGGQDIETEGIWKWIGGPESGETFWNQYKPVTDKYTNWRDSEPNNVDNEDCMIINVAGWNDVPCETHQAALLIEYGDNQLLEEQPQKSEL